MKNTISEEGALISVEEKGIVTKNMDVFYNPKMKLNRDLAIQIMSTYFNFPVRVALPLCGSGVRGVRFLLDCSVEKIYFNDLSMNAINSAKENVLLNENKIMEKQNKPVEELTEFHNKDANVFLRENSKFDYIDIDPFGSSVPFLESAIVSVKKNGIIAITNTDTAALCGSYPKVTKRRYGAVPFNNAVRQQFGIRILIRKAQEIGCMHDRALIPILSYSKEHYVRVYFKVSYLKEDCARILGQHGFVKSDKNRLLSPSNDSGDLGPVWLGKLYDEKLVSVLKGHFVENLCQDSLLDSLFYFFDPHEVSKLNNLEVSSYTKLKEIIEKKGFKMLRTHFYTTGILTNIDKEELLNIMLNMKNGR